MRNKCKHKKPKLLAPHHYTNKLFSWWWCDNCGATRMDKHFFHKSGLELIPEKGKWKSPTIAIT